MNNLAFLVSCGEYSRDEIENLPGLDEDVAKIRYALLQYCGVEEKNCYCLCESKDSEGGPTEPELWNMLDEPDDSKEYKAIYFYYSGHGFQNRDNELCIMTRDSRLKPYPMMYTKIEDIVRFLKNTYEYKYIIFILDMCQTYRNDAKGVSDIEFPYGIITICSCLPDGESYLMPEDTGKGSLFTECFIKALEQARVQDTIGEIVENTRKRMLLMDKYIDSGQICYLKVTCYELGKLTLGTLCGIEKEKQQSFETDTTFKKQGKYISYVPKVVENFMGRRQELQWIDDQLRFSTKPIFLSGDGGIGKTTLVLRFMELHSEYKFCFSAYHSNIFHTIAMIKILDEIGPDSDETSLTEIELFEKNMQLLEQQGSNLVLFIDNFDSENYDMIFFELMEQKPEPDMEIEFKNESIIERLAKSGIHLIFTTRVKIPEGRYCVYNLEAMPPKILSQLVIRNCEELCFDEKAKKALLHIIKKIGGLTILIELIASVLKKHSNFETLYELEDVVSNEKYGEYDVEVKSDYDFENTTIFNHLHHMFDFLELSEKEQDILRIISLLPYEGISIKLFYDLNRDILNDEFIEVTHELDALRLINIDKNWISMHPIISAFVKIELKPDAINCKKFLENLLESYHTDATETYSREFIEEICLTLSQAAKRIDQLLMKSELYAKAGVIARRSGMYVFSKEVQLKAISTLENAPLPDLKMLATYHSNIANLYLDMADLENAEIHQKEAIRIRIQQLGEEHPDTAMSYCNMALILAQKAKYSEAKDYQEKAIKILEDVQSDNELSLAIAYSNMAQICYDEKNYENSLMWEQKALNIRKKNLDADSPYIAVSYNNISLYYHKLGNEDKAEEYVRMAIEIQERVLGLNHPYLAISYNNLALVLKAKGDYKAAIKYQLKDVAIKQSGTKDDHWNLATSYDNMADLMILTGEYGKAKEYQIQAIKIREMVQGTNHPDLVYSYQNMIDILSKLDQWDEAAHYCEKLARLKKNLSHELD